MQFFFNEFLFTDDKNLIKIDDVEDLIRSSYWAEDRSLEVIKSSIQNSICYGVYTENRQVGFARVVTDLSTMYWLCDVIIHKEYKNQGLGKKLVDIIVSDSKFSKLLGILATRDAHNLYEKYGFQRDHDRFMRKPRALNS